MSVRPYTTLTTADELALKRDQLRGKESDHVRLSEFPEEAGGPGRIEELEEKILRLRRKVDKLEERVAAEEAAVEAGEQPGQPDAPVEDASPATPDDGS